MGIFTGIKDTALGAIGGGAKGAIYGYLGTLALGIVVGAVALPLLTGAVAAGAIGASIAWGAIGAFGGAFVGHWAGQGVAIGLGAINMVLGGAKGMSESHSAESKDRTAQLAFEREQLRAREAQLNEAQNALVNRAGDLERKAKGGAFGASLNNVAAATSQAAAGNAATGISGMPDIEINPNAKGGHVERYHNQQAAEKGTSAPVKA